MLVTSTKDHVNCVHDTADLLHRRVVHQLVAQVAARGPAGRHRGVGRYFPHLGEGQLGEVLEERIDIASWSVGRGGLLPGREVPLVLENEAANVSDKKSSNDWFGLGVSSRRQHVGGFKDTLDRGDVGEVPLLDGTLQDRQEEVLVDLPLDQAAVLLLLAGDSQPVDPDAPGAVVLLKGVHLEQHAVDSLVLGFQGLPQAGVLRCGGLQHGLEAGQPGGHGLEGRDLAQKPIKSLVETRHNIFQLLFGKSRHCNDNCGMY